MRSGCRLRTRLVRALDDERCSEPVFRNGPGHAERISRRGWRGGGRRTRGCVGSGKPARRTNPSLHRRLARWIVWDRHGGAGPAHHRGSNRSRRAVWPDIRGAATARTDMAALAVGQRDAEPDRCRLGVDAALILIGLRAATGELNDTDVVQFYWGWFNEVRHLGGVWLTPELPLIQDFSAGRGNGNYLFFAGFAPGHVSHVVSAVFCVMFAMGLRSFVLRAAPPSTPGDGSSMLLVADLACMTALWMLPGAVAFGKYHLQFAAWALGFTLVCLEIVTADPLTSRTRRLMLVPLAIAIPIGLAQFEAFILLAVLCAVAVAPDRRLAAMRLFPLLLAGCANVGVSLCANWLYLGIP